MENLKFIKDFSKVRKVIFDELIDIAFPPTCCFCNKIITGEFIIQGICRKCLPQIPLRFGDNLEISCIDKNLHFHPMINTSANINVLVACRYEDPLKKALLDFKFYEASYYREFFGSVISYVFFDKIKSYDYIIPVPLHKNRKNERGYNQSELIADKISGIVKIPVMNNVLTRKKYTHRQSEMKNETDRAANVSDVFECLQPEKLIDKKILILDDVLTSGSTMSYAANAIIDSVNQKSKGIGKIQITGLVVASGRNC